MNSYDAAEINALNDEATREIDARDALIGQRVRVTELGNRWNCLVGTVTHPARPVRGRPAVQLRLASGALITVEVAALTLI